MTEDVAAQKTWVSSVEKLFLDAKKLAELIKSGMWADIFTESEKKLKRLEEKLEALSRKELELYVTSQ